MEISKQMPKVKLLVVDDDSGIRTQLKWGLDSYDVITANSREKAITQFESNRPSLVTLDLGLPPDAEGTSEGFAILQAILARAPKTKVVVVSGSDELINSKIALERGAFEFYPKPIDIDDLKSILEKAYIEFKGSL